MKGDEHEEHEVDEEHEGQEEEGHGEEEEGGVEEDEDGEGAETEAVADSNVSINAPASEEEKDVAEAELEQAS